VSSLIRNRIVRGTFANVIAVAFNQGSTLVANVLVARLLNKTGYGEYAIVVSTLLTVATLAQLSTGYTAARYLAEFRSSDKKRAGRIVSACSLFSMASAGIGVGLIVVLSPWIAETLLLAPQLETAFLVGAAFLGFSAINGYQLGALSGLEAFEKLAVAGILSGLSAIAFIGLGAWLGGLNGAVAGLSASAIVRCGIHFVMLRSELRRQQIELVYKGSFRQERVAFSHFALPAALSGFVALAAIWLSNTLLVRQPSGYDQMALFAASNSIRAMVLFMPLTANAVMMSVLNNVLRNVGGAKFREIYALNVFATGLLTAVTAAILALAAPAILEFFGKSFVAGAPIVYVLMGAAVAEGLSRGLYQGLQAKGFIWTSLFYITLPRECVFLAFAVVLIPLYGGFGLAVAYLGGWIICAVVNSVIFRKLNFDVDPIQAETQIHAAGAVN
jgi:O-antigen/teichoic acid export membrane protein